MSDQTFEASRHHLRALDAFRVGDRGPAGWLGPQWLTAIRADPALRQARITVDLVFGGDTVVRLATEPLVTTSATTSRVYTYTPELSAEPDVEWGYQIGSGPSEVRSMSFSLLASLVDPAGIVSSGRMLCGYGEVCLQLDGGDYDQRIVLLRGEMVGGIAFGLGDEEMEVELEDPKITVDLIFPPWVLGTDRHAAPPDDWLGERYPLIMNAGIGVELLRLDTSTTAPDWLAAHGHDITVDASYINGDTHALLLTTSNATDDLGTQYTKISFSVSTWEENDTVQVDVSTGTQRDLIAVIQSLIEGYSSLGVQGVNAPMFAKARSKIPRIVPRVVINASSASDEAGVLSIIESTICASFPMVSMAWRGGKYGPVVTDYRSPLTSFDLTAGQYPLVDRVSFVQEVPKEEVFNRFTVRYDYDGRNNTFRGVVTREPANDPLCLLSEGQVGPRAAETMESRFIATQAHADYVIDWMVAHLSVPSYYVEWSAFPWVALFIELGDRGWFSDPDFGWVAERAVVQRIYWKRGWCVIGLRVYPGRKRLTTLRS